MTMRVVELLWFEWEMAATVGIRRHAIALSRSYSNRNNEPQTYQWNPHVLGACGECAFAKASGLYWSGGLNTFHGRGGDVKHIEVRTRSRMNYDLIIRDDDDPKKPYVLVLAPPSPRPVFHVAGWIYGEEARRFPKKNYGNKGKPAWFVPQEALRPVVREAVR